MQRQSTYCRKVPETRIKLTRPSLHPALRVLSTLHPRHPCTAGGGARLPPVGAAHTARAAGTARPRLRWTRRAGAMGRLGWRPRGQPESDAYYTHRRARVGRFALACVSRVRPYSIWLVACSLCSLIAVINASDVDALRRRIEPHGRSDYIRCEPYGISTMTDHADIVILIYCNLCSTSCCCSRAACG